MERKHIVAKYDQELQRLANMIVEMGGLAESQFAGTLQALTKRDSALAERVVKGDRKLDHMEHEIEELAVRLMALRQPMGVDLREALSAFKISHLLERIGDYAKNVAKRTSVLNQSPPLAPASAMGRLGAPVQQMIKEALDAYVQRDGDLALQVRNRDEEVDEIYDGLFREILTYMMEDPRSITPCTHLLFAAKNIERIGDHVTNIAETIYYLVTGEMLEDDRPKGDLSSFAVVTPEAVEDNGEPS